MLPLFVKVPPIRLLVRPPDRSKVPALIRAPVPETVLLNPTVEAIGSDEEEGWEGCLSVPGMRGVVPRFTRIRYSGFDPQGKLIDREVDGFHARVVQHECDHLIGKLYPMRMRDMSKLGFTSVLFPELGADSDD